MIIPPTWSLPEAIRIRLSQSTYGRQRAIAEEGHVLLVLHQPPGPNDSKREGVLFWRNPRGEWLFSRGASGAAALKRHVQSFGEMENALTQIYEKSEDTKSLFELQAALTPLARAARNMHEALQTAREAVKGDAFLIEVRDLAYEADRSLNLFLEEVRNAIQYHMARESEEQAQLGRAALQASHRLNMLAALCLPLTALTSVFSMGLDSGLNRESPMLFWGIFACGLGLGLGIRSWVMARPKEKENAKDGAPAK